MRNQRKLMVNQAIPTSKRSKFHIIGPFTPQSLELSYSSSGESTNTNPSDTNDPSDPSNPSQSSSHLSRYSPQPPGPSSVKSTSSSRSAASSSSPEWRDTVSRAAPNTPESSGGINWQEYGRPMSGYDAEESNPLVGSDTSTPTPSEDGNGEHKSSPAIDDAGRHDHFVQRIVARTELVVSASRPI